MAPVTSIKTYQKKPALRRRNSIEVFNALLAENLCKRKEVQTAKKSRKNKPIQIKELPPPDENHYLIEDSINNKTWGLDDTFDRVRKGPVYNEKSTAPAKKNYFSSNKTSSTDASHSSISHNEKPTAPVKKNNSSSNKSSSADASHSSISHNTRSRVRITNSKKILSTDLKALQKQEDTLDKSVNISLFIEKVPINVKDNVKEITSLSTPSKGNLENSLLPQIGHPSKCKSAEVSYERIFTKTFRERAVKKQHIASTPAIVSSTPHKCAAVINETISPILKCTESKSLIEKSYEEIAKWNYKPPDALCCVVTPKLKKNKKPKELQKKTIKKAKDKVVEKHAARIVAEKNYTSRNYNVKKDLKLRLMPKIILDKSVDILGISKSVKMNFTRKSEGFSKAEWDDSITEIKKLEHVVHPLEKLLHESFLKYKNYTCDSNTSSDRSLEVRTQTPVRYLVLRKRNIAVASQKQMPKPSKTDVALSISVESTNNQLKNKNSKFTCVKQNSTINNDNVRDDLTDETPPPDSVENNEGQSVTVNEIFHPRNTPVKNVNDLFYGISSENESLTGHNNDDSSNMLIANLKYSINNLEETPAIDQSSKQSNGSNSSNSYETSRTKPNNINDRNTSVSPPKEVQSVIEISTVDEDLMKSQLVSLNSDIESATNSNSCSQMNITKHSPKAFYLEENKRISEEVIPATPPLQTYSRTRCLKNLKVVKNINKEHSYCSPDTAKSKAKITSDSTGNYSISPIEIIAINSDEETDYNEKEDSKNSFEQENHNSVALNITPEKRNVKLERLSTPSSSILEFHNYSRVLQEEDDWEVIELVSSDEEICNEESNAIVPSVNNSEPLNNQDDSANRVKTLLDTADLILPNTSASESLNEITTNEENSDKEEEDMFVLPSLSFKQPKSLVLRPGKSWRRSLLEMRRASVIINGCICTSKCQSKDSQKSCSSIKHRRTSIRFVPEAPLCTIQCSSNASMLENFAVLSFNTTYVSNNIQETVYVEKSIGESVVHKSINNSIHELTPHEVAREIVLRRCGQAEPLPFGECYPASLLRNCFKIGEGVYGEVFLFRNSSGGSSVMKVIPIEGSQLVNGEQQKKYEEILSEIIIAMELSNLRNNKKNKTDGFSEVQKVKCVQGCYPEQLLELWSLYDETRGSENDSPEMFSSSQLYIVLELANGGKDMESFVFKNSIQAYALFEQTACALAVAESALEFEHRDLHWGNILISLVDKNKKFTYCLNGQELEIPACGIEVSIIDFTLSRIKYDGVSIYNDISNDPDLFSATGDYQFEIYKLMQKRNENQWEHFEPYTNILWLHYMLDKMVNALRYKNVNTKTHKDGIAKLCELKERIFEYSSVNELVMSEFAP